ncbi:penicillin-binding protein activator [Acetobacteraceae bacterium]|nr:penicillin-binding protein activator [Acetobacteraceae bacterium]
MFGESMNKNKPFKKYSVSQLNKNLFIAGSCLLLSGCFSPKSHSSFHEATSENGEIALFLPLSGSRSPVASQLRNAAMLAFEDENGKNIRNVKIFDTGLISPQKAAEQAIADKASIVLGPITADETQEASSKLLASGIPEVSFTSDSRQSKEGLWVAGLTARQQVSRLLEALKAENKFKVAAFLPSNDFGKSFGEALLISCQENNFPTPQIVYHDESAEQIAQNLQFLAKTEDRQKAFEVAKAASSTATLEAPPFQALLLVDTGINLRNIINYLPDSDIRPSEVQIMGPALWRAFDAKLSAISGAWYAAPSDENREAYVQKYEQKYHQKPLMITDIAYDLATVTKELQNTHKLSAKKMVKADAFKGIDGSFSFKENGRMERDLALYQILPSGGAKIMTQKDLIPATPVSPAVETVKTAVSEVQNSLAPSETPAKIETPQEAH